MELTNGWALSSGEHFFLYVFTWGSHSLLWIACIISLICHNANIFHRKEALLLFIQQRWRPLPNCYCLRSSAPLSRRFVNGSNHSWRNYALVDRKSNCSRSQSLWPNLKDCDEPHYTLLSNDFMLGCCILVAMRYPQCLMLTEINTRSVGYTSSCVTLITFRLIRQNSTNSARRAVSKW